jgi:hypothetical protein
MKKLFLILVISLTSLSIFAQIPGYQGRKLNVELQGCFALLATSKENERSNSIYPRLSVDYAVLRKGSLNFNYSYRGIKSSKITIIDFTTSSTGEYIVTNFKGGVHNFGIGYTNYWRNYSLAPLGRYTSYGFLYSFGTADIPFRNLSLNASASSLVLDFKWGRRIITSGNISVDYGIQVVVPCSFLNDLVTPGSVINYDKAFSNFNQLQLDSILLQNLKGKTWYEGMLCVYLSVGGIF